MAVRWGHEKIIIFIEEYHRNECLWELKSPLYKNRDARDAAYNNIIETMNRNGVAMTVKEVKNKIKSLRTTYFSEVAKVESSKKTGSGTDDVYKPKLSWFDSMGFLRTSDEMRDVEENSVDTQSTTDSRENTPATNYSSHSSSLHHRKSAIRTARYDPLDAAVRELRRINTSTQEENEFDVFGHNVSLQLQKLPLDYALETQELILKVLKEQRIKLLKQQSRLQDPVIISIPNDIDIVDYVLNKDITDTSIVETPGISTPGTSGATKDILKDAVHSVSDLYDSD